MKKSEEPSSFYYEAINLIDLDDYDGAINSIKKNIDRYLNKARSSSSTKVKKRDNKKQKRLQVKGQCSKKIIRVYHVF